jgi:hypothetical protein
VERRDRPRIADVTLECVDGGQCSLGGIELFLVAAGHENRVSAFEKVFRQFESDAARPPVIRMVLFFSFIGFSARR